ncbi:MAG TPA: hypothetical protein P5077_10855 [bacterium]|nr:hypothetical protein [bacterium]
MQLNDILREQLAPAQALIIYRRAAAADRPVSLNNEAAYIELHPIVTAGDRYALGPGAPLTKKQVIALAALAGADRSALLGGFLPATGRLLYLDPSPAAPRILWWRPPEKREIIFDERQSGIASGEYPLPALLFDLADRSLSVHAVAGDFVTPRSPVKNAPLPNIYDDGRICMGNCRLPAMRGDIADLIERYEELFYRSEFTHFIHKEPTRSPVTSLFKALAGSDAFPVEELTPLNGRSVTVAQLINNRRR